MLFNTLEFLIFFVVLIGLFVSSPARLRPHLLLVASYFFYMCWNVKYIVLILFTTLFIYLAALFIEKYKELKIKKLILVASLSVNLGLLFIFKYYNFSTTLIGDLNRLLQIDINIPTLKILLPVGISFYTFQALGYLIDVYRSTI